MNLKLKVIVLISSLLAISFSALGQNKPDSVKTTVLKAVAAKPDTAKASIAKSDKPVVGISDIPGITTTDRTPHACVDCHANHPEMKMDFRLTTVLASWDTAAPPEIVKKAQAVAPSGRKLKGRHPDVGNLVTVVPDDCLMCHVRDSKIAPPFTKLLHAIHLTGGEKNHFLTKANGTCTSCHKLDVKTGTWGLGHGEEK